MTSAETDYLFRLATLSLSFVGFSSVVIALRGALGGKLSDRHLRLVRLYIEGGLLVTALALVPTLLVILHLAESVVWSLASAIAALVFTVVLIIQFRRRRAIEPSGFPPWVVVIYVISALAVAALWFNAAGTSFAPGGGTYAIVLTWAICIFGFIFVRTIEIFLNRPPED